MAYTKKAKSSINNAINFLYDSLESTNTFLIENIDSFNSFDTVRANIQTNGHGQFDRKWISNQGGLYFSLVIPNGSTSLNILRHITSIACITLSQLLENEFSIKSKIKWPNDIFVNNSKISGILCESTKKKNGDKFQILGIGININQNIEDLKEINRDVTSIYIENSLTTDINTFLQKFLKNFYLNFQILKAKGFIAFYEFFKENLLIFENEINIRIASKTLIGKIKTISKDGALIFIESSSNKEIEVFSAEILE